MAVASISRIRKRVIALLLAHPRGGYYTDNVGGKSTYASLQEITDAVVDADMNVCLAILDTPGHPYASGWQVASSNLASGDFLPPFIGAHGRVIIDPTGTGTFKRAVLARSADEMAEVVNNPTLYPNCKLFYFIEGNCIEHSGSAARVYYPSFSKTDAACQAHELYTSAVLAGALALLYKDGGDPQFFGEYAQIFALADAAIRAGEKTLPDIERLRVTMREGRQAA